jgi:hypothetical protein
MSLWRALILAQAFLAGACTHHSGSPGGRGREVSENSAQPASSHGETQSGKKLMARDELVERMRVNGADPRSLKRLINMSEAEWMVGEENIMHGKILCEIRDRWPVEFDQALKRSRARESAEVLMDAAENDGVFPVKPGAIVLRGDPADTPKVTSIDLRN